jgi:hypothetical protein
VSLFPPSPYLSTSLSPRLSLSPSLQRHNAKIRNKYSQKRNCAATGPNFHIHVSVSDLYIPTIDLPILLQENMWNGPGNTYINPRHMNVEIGTEAAQVPEKEYTNGIFVAVYFSQASTPSPPLHLPSVGAEEWRGTNLSVRTRWSMPSQQELNTVLEFLNNLWGLGTE